MKKKMIVSSLVFSLLAGCNAQEAQLKAATESEARLAEQQRVEREKKFTEVEKIVLDPKKSELEKANALNELKKIDPDSSNRLKMLLETKSQIASSKTPSADSRHIENQLAAEKKKKKQEGVRIGMTMQDVLDSSWGKPQHRTTYHTSMGEHTIWQYGEYGERGTISFNNGIIDMIQN